MLEHGTGALNIDECRVPGPKAGTVGNGRVARWPANVLLDEDAAELLDQQAPDTGAYAPVKGTEPSKPAKNVYGEFRRGGGAFYGDRGGASRFFYTAKASRLERGEGNDHPTVKPVALMCWLVRLVVPPGGLVLDPFAGSGTTGIAALREGFQFVGIEENAKYCRLARKRIFGDAPLFNRGLRLGEVATG